MASRRLWSPEKTDRSRDGRKLRGFSHRFRFLIGDMGEATSNGRSNLRTGFTNGRMNNGAGNRDQE